jgi:hypothetical protein
LLFCEERTAGIAEIRQFRLRVAETEAQSHSAKESELDKDVEDEKNVADDIIIDKSETREPQHDIEMDAEDVSKTKDDGEQDQKEEPAPMQADDDDAVEY